VSVQRGGVLVGAYDAQALIGFVFSFPALRRATSSDAVLPSHWSHMLGVHPGHRHEGVGRALKLAQRDRVLALGLDLIEWTFDPLQALNAHLNFVTLGVVVEQYEENVYGESISPLHGGLPTDRFVCQWWIRRPHVERRLAPAAIPLVARDVENAPNVNRTSTCGEWLAPEGFDSTRTEPWLRVAIPGDFTRMLATDAGLARRWRLESRAVFQHYFSRGYRVVDFAFEPNRQCGRYLLTSIPKLDDGL
jgi:predicted GNAT superfamily acetyltransferase